MSVVSIANKLKRGNLLVGNSYYIPPSFESIATVTLGSPASTITLDNIPSTYKHLQIRAKLQATGPSGASVYGGWYWFNGENTGTNYWTSSVYSAAQDATKAQAYAVTSDSKCWGATYTTSDATNKFSYTIMDILDYTNTNKNTLTRVISGTDINAAAYSIQFNSGLWRNTAVVNSITFSPNTGFGSYNFVAGSKISVYGIKG